MKRLMVLLGLMCSSGFAALEFDGSFDRVDVSDHADFDFSGAFTLACWADPDDTDALRACVERYDNTSRDGYVLYQSTTDSGVWRFTVYVNAVQQYVTSDAAPSGSWQHICGVRDGSGNMYLYVDGVKQVDTASNAGALDSTGNLRFGMRYAGDWNYAGKLQDVAVWDTNLSDNQVALLASSRMARIPLMIEKSNLIGYWPLDDQPAGTAASGDTAYDIGGSTNQHNGTVTSSSNWLGGVLTYAQMLEWKPIYWLFRGSEVSLPVDPFWIRRRLWL